MSIFFTFIYLFLFGCTESQLKYEGIFDLHCGLQDLNCRMWI